ncbi:MAG TPA: glycogen/starch/alpha-glucan phosphorylase, partial [Burkholderiales bacterium]|nr:glycogen/starch/alpha-glucan phosphorylase [Burkholderiales bacterium]
MTTAKLRALDAPTQSPIDVGGRLRVRWVPDMTVIGVPYDTPILGYSTHTANTLRLWCAEAPEAFDFSVLQAGVAIDPESMFDVQVK